MYRSVFVLMGLSMLLLSSCDEKSNDKPEDSTKKGATTSESSTQEITKIEFQDSLKDFGLVMDGKVLEHEFIFTNTGNKPLVIKEAKASCGCTLPEYSKDPIAPGGQGKIKVRHDTKGRSNKDRPEGNVYTKSVTVTSNTVPDTHTLTIKVNCVPAFAGETK